MNRPAAGMVLALILATTARASEPKVEKYTPNKPDEPKAKKFSPDAAARFLDTASLDWQNQKKCFSCHTNYAYLYARPALSLDTPAQKEVRRFAEEQITERWEKQGPRYLADVVATAHSLATNDAHTTGKLHPLTRRALDRMWTIQREDGGWEWIKCNWPPLESDDHYGVTLAALAVGVAPEGYAKTEAAKKGLANIQRYFKANPPTMVHHRAMLLWVSSYLDGFMTEQEKKAVIKELRDLQKDDGGWAVATLGEWKRADRKEQDRESSDGYATGFVVYVLRKSGVAADDPAVKKGVAWLKTNQRESGRWYSRSLNNDGKHYLSHVGTAFAVMALAECGELKE